MYLNLCAMLKKMDEINKGSNCGSRQYSGNLLKTPWYAMRGSEEKVTFCLCKLQLKVYILLKSNDNFSLRSLTIQLENNKLAKQKYAFKISILKSHSSTLMHFSFMKPASQLVTVVAKNSNDTIQIQAILIGKQFLQITQQYTKQNMNFSRLLTFVRAKVSHF